MLFKEIILAYSESQSAGKNQSYVVTETGSLTLVSEVLMSDWADFNLLTA
jgi:hypothetical protein